MAVLSAPISSAIAAATSMANRARFSMEPPYSSLRVLAFEARNCWTMIAIRTVNLDTIGTGQNGGTRRKAKVGEGLSHFLGRQRTRRGNVLQPCCGKRLRPWRDRGGCYALTMMRRVVGVRHTSENDCLVVMLIEYPQVVRRQT
jgi:hypothetical protein